VSTLFPDLPEPEVKPKRTQRRRAKMRPTFMWRGAGESRAPERPQGRTDAPGAPRPPQRRSIARKAEPAPETAPFEPVEIPVYDSLAHGPLESLPVAQQWGADGPKLSGQCNRCAYFTESRCRRNDEDGTQAGAKVRAWLARGALLLVERNGRFVPRVHPQAAPCPGFSPAAKGDWYRLGVMPR
jgi:hypothetical protein